MVAYIYNPRTREEDCEFEASLNYIVGLRPVWAFLVIPVSKYVYTCVCIYAASDERLWPSQVFLGHAHSPACMFLDFVEAHKYMKAFQRTLWNSSFLTFSLSFYTSLSVIQEEAASVSWDAGELQWIFFVVLVVLFLTKQHFENAVCSELNSVMSKTRSVSGGFQGAARCAG
jgi:hypothetical protein